MSPGHLLCTESVSDPQYVLLFTTRRMEAN
jgi:hypothetical protein